jgi:septum formation protein
VTQLVLASASPQRRAILEQLGIEFEVAEPHVEEISAGDPRAAVVENALRKARSIGGSVADRRVLGVDTEVALAGRIYGKPGDEDEARAFLSELGGREHQVWSGIALLAAGGEERTATAVTTVRFRSLEPGDLDWYLASGEWRGRAGGYAIQGRGAALVDGIEGDYWNVVGLPVAALTRVAPELFGL